MTRRSCSRCRTGLAGGLSHQSSDLRYPSLGGGHAGSAQGWKAPSPMSVRRSWVSGCRWRAGSRRQELSYLWLRSRRGRSRDLAGLWLRIILIFPPWWCALWDSAIGTGGLRSIYCPGQSWRERGRHSVTVWNWFAISLTSEAVKSTSSKFALAYSKNS